MVLLYELAIICCHSYISGRAIPYAVVTVFMAGAAKNVARS